VQSNLHTLRAGTLRYTRQNARENREIFPFSRS
jgi:hypothetical protein